MQYSRMGNSGLVVSRLALGTMTFTGDASAQGVAKVDQAKADTIVAQALDAGITFFNSADVYAGGAAEVVLGRALGDRRKNAVIATKLGHRMAPDLLSAGLSRRWIIRAVEDSLRRLGTDWIDLYLFHKLDPLTPIEEMLAALDQLVRDGKVLYGGVSNWPAWATAKAVEIQKVRGYQPFTSAEVYYSLVGRDVEQEIVPLALDAGIGLTPWSPLAGGLLSGKYRDDPTGGGGRLNIVNQFNVEATRANAVVDALREVAAAHGSEPAQVAIAWLLARPAVASVIIGANTPDQLASNIAASDLVLTADEIATLDSASATQAPYPGWLLERGKDRRILEALGA